MTALEDILSQEIVQRLGWTLLHFIWQATAIALLLAILLVGLRKASANLRYTVSCLALALIVLLPTVTMWLVDGGPAQPPVVPESAQAPVVLRTEQVEEIPMAQMQVVEVSTKSEEPRKVPAIPWRQRAAERIEPALPYIVSGWLLGVFALSLRHLGGWTQLQRLRRKLVKPVDVSLRAKLDELAETLGVKRAVQLTESALVQIPTVVGWLRPVILLPASALTGLSTEQLEAILAHELAHIRRRDYLVNMLQTIVETLGFYHPAVWWVSHRIRTEREDCCDDLAVAVSGDRITYARALTSMEQIRAGRSGLAVAASGGNLLRRVCRLLGKDSDDHSRVSWIPSAITILLIAAIVIPTTFALTARSETQPSAIFPLDTQHVVSPDVVNPETLGGDQANAPVGQDKPTESRQEADSALGSVQVLPTVTKSSIPVSEDKPIVRVDCRVLEIYPPGKVDRETQIAIENLLATITTSTPREKDGVMTRRYRISGKSTRTGEKPTVKELIREAAGAAHADDDSSIVTRDPQATQHLRTMVDLLASRGWVKILMNPTLEVVDGGKAEVSSTQRIPMGKVAKSSTQSDSYRDVVDYLRITPEVLQDGDIMLWAEGTFTRLVAPKSEEQARGMTETSISTQARTIPGRSLIIHGRNKPVKNTGTDSDPNAPDEQAGELMFILTPTISDTVDNADGQADVPAGQDKPIEDLNSVGSAAGTVRSVGSAIENPTASDEGKPYIRIDALVVEILDHSRMDRETFIQAQNKLNLTISASSGWTPTPEELVREAAGSRVWVDGSLEMLSIVGDRQATQEQYNAMVNVLASRGLVKMLMSPTLEVVAGGKARISAVHKVPIGNGASRPAKSAYHVDVTDCLEVTTHIVDDEMIGLQTEGTVNGQLLRPNEPPHLARRTFSKHVVLEPGMSLIVGGTDQTEGLVRTQTDVLFILTPTIARAGEPSDENERQLDDEPTGRPGARTVSAMTTRATSPAKGATPIRIGCFVLEIPYYPGADKNIARDAWTILGDKMSVPPVDSGPVAYAGRLLKAVIEEPHPADKDWGRDITVTQAELEKLIRMLAAGGYIRILFEPTVLVGDGQTAEVRNDRQSFRVKADLLDDGDMVLQTHVSVGSEIAPQDKDQKPMATVRTFDTTAHLRPGRAAIVGGAGTAPTSTVSREAKHTAEIMCILTTDKDDSTTTEDGGNKGGDRTNNENVERPTPRTSAQQDKIHYPRNWGEVVGNGVIGIATAKALPRNMVTRVYDVTDLVGDPADHGGMTRVMQVHSLVHLIQSQVEPDSWYDVSDAGQGTATPFPLQEPKKLAVYNTVEVHRQIERLLQAVRSGAERVPVPQEMTIRGRCIDSEGRPLSDSRVLVFSVTDAPKQIAQARTDSRGYFKLGPVASLTEEDYGRKRYLILVYADGHGPAWKRIYEHEQAASLLELKAYDSAEVIGTIVTENSKPAAGALVWVRGIIPPEATEDPNSRDNDLFTPAPLPEWSATTGSDGSFRIAGLADRSRIQLGVTHPDFAESLVHVKPGKSAVIEVQPAATVTGRVLYGKTGEPAVGVRVQAQGVDHTSIPGGWMLGWAETTTDNQGRYMLRSLAGNSYNIWAKAEDLTVRALDSFKVEAGQAHQAPDLRLIEGGFIAGRVIDEVTGESVKPGFASDVAVYGPSRPKSGAAVEISHVREDGSFRIRAAPGRNYVYLRPMDDWGREKAAVYPPGHWANVATGQSVKVEFKIRKYSQEELDRQDNRGSRIRIRIPKTVDELDQSGSRMKQLRAGAPQRPSSKPFDRWIVLNAALKMYSKDHDGKLPDDLGALESYIPLRQHFEWIVENTEFLAPGRHLGLMQNWAPIACDKEYFANGWFADVLFSDGHTESMYPAQIKELAELDRQVKESGEMLMYFGRAMLIYANDHDGRYPNLPDQLREYLRTDQFTWAMRNVEYLAAGKTTSSPPDVVLAYRKLIPGAKGTNVLFNDGHVEFVSGARMRDLNISIAPILIETRILTVDDNFLRAIELDANSVGTSELLSAASGAEPNSWPYLVVLDDLEVNHLLRAVAAHDGAKILAAPQVVALDGREAKIKIVSEEYHLLRPTDPNDPPEKAKPKPEAVEVGTSIRLTPHVTRDKKNIVLDFEWVLRQIRGFEQRAGPDKKKHKFPLVSVNETRTTATIPEGKTLVVGRKNTEQVEVSSKTPVLGDLPLVGGLFRNYSKITDKKTLLILIKPTVDPQMPHPPPLDPDDPLAKKLRWKFERDEMSRDID